MARAAAHRRSTNILGSLGLGKFVATAGLLLAGLGLKAHNDTTAVVHNDTTKTINLTPAQLPPTFEVDEFDTEEDVFETESDLKLSLEVLNQDSAEYETAEHEESEKPKKKKKKVSVTAKAPIRISDYTNIMATTPSVKVLAAKRNKSVEDLLKPVVKMLQVESPAGDESLDMAAKSSSSKASGIYQFMPGTRNGLLKKASPAVQAADAAAVTPEEIMRVDNDLFAMLYDQNLEYGDRIFSLLQMDDGDGIIEEVWFYNKKGQECRVAANDPRLIEGFACMAHFGQGHIDDNLSRAEVGNIDGKRTLRIPTSIVNGQDAMKHLCAAGFKLELENHSPDYYMAGALSRLQLMQFAAHDQVQHETVIDEFAIPLAGLITELDSLFPGQIKSGSTCRDYYQQLAEWKKALRKYGSKASKYCANPQEDISNHMLDGASDLKYFDGPNGSRADVMLAAHTLAPKYGLCFPMDHEPWHVELAPGPVKDYIRSRVPQSPKAIARRHEHHHLNPDIERILRYNALAAEQYADILNESKLRLQDPDRAAARAAIQRQQNSEGQIVQTVSAPDSTVTTQFSDDSYFYKLTSPEEAEGSSVFDYVVEGLESVASNLGEAAGVVGEFVSDVSWPFRQPVPEDQGRDDPAIAQKLRRPAAVNAALYTRERGAGSAPPLEDGFAVLQPNDVTRQDIRGLEGTEEAGPVILTVNDKDSFAPGDVVEWQNPTSSIAQPQQGFAPGDVIVWESPTAPEQTVDTVVVDEVQPVVAQEFQQNVSDLCSDMFREKYFGRKITIEGVGEREINEEFLKEAQAIYGGKVANFVLAGAINNFDRRTTQDREENPNRCALSARSVLAKRLAKGPTPAV